MCNKPKIFVSSTDYDKLQDVLYRLPQSDAVDRLLNELDRAEITDSQKILNNVAAMYSTVTFTVLQTDKSFTHKLVYPGDKLEDGHLSILTPVGSALLGLAIGQEIKWSFENGKTTLVRIDNIVND